MNSGIFASLPIERRFVAVDGLSIHYRVAGEGPPVVMLHDSPRSSRLHLATMHRLARRFRVYALDTPGYGNSDPLGIPHPTIADFAEALARTLTTLGLTAAPLYATHTSAKIALEYAASLVEVEGPTAAAARPAHVILDGLSIPSGPPNPDFIAAYMRPFVIEGTGGYLAAEWTRMRDMLRWFPWFDQRPGTRMVMDTPDDAWIADYTIDFLSAGPNYSSAYAAAMYYDPMPALRAVTCPVLVAAKADDVLYACLDAVPVEQNPALSVERLGVERDDWLGWLETKLSEAAEPIAACAPATPPAYGATYVDVPHGQMFVHRNGEEHGTPLLILSAPTTLQARAFADAMPGRATLVPQLPGFGESDALADPTLEAFSDALAMMLAGLDIDKVDILAIDFATPLAAHLAAHHPSRVGRVILDGCFHMDAAQGDMMALSLCPNPAFDISGGHILALWHSLRDAEASWPWYSTHACSARDRMPLLNADALHAALVEILKQPGTYGDLASAACRADDAHRFALFSHEAVLLDRPDDPGYRGTAALADRLENARIVPRPASIADTAAVIETML